MESPTERAIYTVRYAIATMPVVQRGYNFEQASYMRWAGRVVLIRLLHPIKNNSPAQSYMRWAGR